MKIFADAGGAVIGISLTDEDGPEGTERTLTLDQETNPSIARIAGEQTEWPNLRVEDDKIFWHGASIPIAPEGEAKRQRAATNELVGRLFGETGEIPADDLRAILQMLVRRHLV